jgi:hypothetical protein
MNFEPFLLEEWLIKCLGARIDLDHSGAPNPMRDGFDPCVGGEAFLNEFEVEEKLYKAISAAYKVKRERIALTCGAQSANFAFLNSCFERGDLVAVESPTYAPIHACADALFKSVLPVARKREEGYAVDRSSFRAALRKGAKVVALTNLHNPSAKLLSDEQLADLLEQAEEKGALVLVDEVYREMAHRRPPKGAFELGSNGVTTNGLSKLWRARSPRPGSTPPGICRRGPWPSPSRPSRRGNGSASGCWRWRGETCPSSGTGPRRRGGWSWWSQTAACTSFSDCQLEWTMRGFPSDY